MKSIAVIVLLGAVLVKGQRPSFAGSRPIGYPVLVNRTTTESGLADKFGEDTTTQRLPIEANGDRDLVDRLSKLPIDQQPFWFINWQALEAHRQKPQSYPQRPSQFVENSFTPGNPNWGNGPRVPSPPANTNFVEIQPSTTENVMKEVTTPSNTEDRFGNPDLLTVSTTTKKSVQETNYKLSTILPDATLVEKEDKIITNRPDFPAKTTNKPALDSTQVGNKDKIVPGYIDIPAETTTKKPALSYVETYFKPKEPQTNENHFKPIYTNHKNHGNYIEINKNIGSKYSDSDVTLFDLNRGVRMSCYVN